MRSSNTLRLVALAAMLLLVFACSPAPTPVSAPTSTATVLSVTPTATIVSTSVPTMAAAATKTPAPRPAPTVEVPPPPSAQTECHGALHTEASSILDSSGRPCVLKGVNWFGLETSAFAPGGLAQRNFKDIMTQIKSLGFNSIRLPFSNQCLRPETRPAAWAIKYDINPELQGLTCSQVMDKIVEQAGAIGLRVVLDRHQPDSSGRTALWYTPGCPESCWTDDWVALAKRYIGNSAVIGADLHNEPHGPNPPSDLICWGCSDPAKDWARAAEAAGNAVLAINPNWLIIVEGIDVVDNQWYWYGGNLLGVQNHPVPLGTSNKLVYSVHDYPESVYAQSWFSDPGYPNNLPPLWDKFWGYLKKGDIAPVYVGEFGTKLQTQKDSEWLDVLVKYLKDNGVSWSYWDLNPESADTGGLFLADWKTVDDRKLRALQPLLSK